MADATVTLRLTPGEFDTIRDALTGERERLLPMWREEIDVEAKRALGANLGAIEDLRKRLYE